jgi:hypothetical protein
MSELPTTRSSARWIMFAALMLMAAGTIDVFNGLWAIGADETRFDTVIYDDNIDAWGWFYILIGVVQMAAGWAVLQRATWARVAGIAFGFAGATLNIFWVFLIPVASLVLITLNILVIYALVVYGGDEQPF